MQIPLAEESKRVLAFGTSEGLWEWQVTPFGTSSGSNTQQCLADKIVGKHKYKGMFAYQDDYFLYSKTLKEHRKLINILLTNVAAAGITLKRAKCQIAYTTLTVLGHVIKDGKLEADKNKTRAVAEMRNPTGISELRTFLGMASYLRRYIPKFAEIAAPLGMGFLDCFLGLNRRLF